MADQDFQITSNLIDEIEEATSSIKPAVKVNI